MTSAFQFKVTFTADNNSGKIFGQTTEKPFMTPYSSTKATVTFSYYFGCNTAKPPGVKGSKTMSNVIEKMLDSSTLTFTSESEIVADTNASLIIKFKPAPSFHEQGQVQINVPGWYITERATNFSPAVYSSESMINADSIVSFPNSDYVVESQRYDKTNRSMLILYSGSKDTTDVVEIKIEGFKNPVNKRARSGFKLTIMDPDGNLMNMSEPDQPLVFNLTKVA